MDILMEKTDIIITKTIKFYFLLFLIHSLGFHIFAHAANEKNKVIFLKKIVEPPILALEGNYADYILGIKDEVTACRHKLNLKEGADYIYFDGRKVDRLEWCVRTGEALLKWAGLCQDFKELQLKIKENFDWYQSMGDDGDGKIKVTGYYSPTLKVSMTRTKEFKYPIYRNPQDLVFHRGKWCRKDLKGNYVPYYSRKEIEEGRVLKGKNLEIAYSDSLYDVFILQVQGAGAIEYVDKIKTKRKTFLNYSGENGHQYISVRSIMKAKGIADEFLTIPGQRKYFKQYPEQMVDILNSNPSYVFFEPMKNGPFGATNTVLRSGHSIAIDSFFHPLSGFALVTSIRPLFDEFDHITSWTPYSRMAIAHDQGGAINGGRLDFYWGDDHYAEQTAGVLNENGALYFILPKP